MAGARQLPHRTHPAVRGFDRAARSYERGRPGYPEAAVRYLARDLGLRPRRTVVELASGTGKFTRSLMTTGATVVPVEPTRGMREEFTRQFPAFPVLDGIAEAIPVPERFADAIVCAQAFHWFRPGAALKEAARVLVPGGGIGLVWNIRETSTPWVRELNRVVYRYRDRVPRSRERGWKSFFARGRSPFGTLTRKSFPSVQRLDLPTLVERFLSVSYVAVQSASEQRRIAQEIREIVRHDPLTRGRSHFDLPYQTEVYVSHLRARA